MGKLNNFLLIIILLFHVDTCYSNNKDKIHVNKKVDVTPNENNTNIFSINLEYNKYYNNDYLNFTLDFSSSNNVDIQLITYSLPIKGNSDGSYEFNTFLNVSKLIDFNSSLSLLIGSQFGTTIFYQPRYFQDFNYTLIEYNFNQDINIHSGLYFSNKEMSTTKNMIDYTIGTSIDLLNRKFELQIDYFAGNNSISGTTTNLYYNISNNKKVYLGFYLPDCSGNDYYGILGFNFSFNN